MIGDNSRAVGRVAALMIAELSRAQRKFGPMRSQHEGYAVVLEEVDELWADVKAGEEMAALREAVQVAAMAMRFVVDCGTSAALDELEAEDAIR